MSSLFADAQSSDSLLDCVVVFDEKQGLVQVVATNKRCGCGFDITLFADEIRAACPDASADLRFWFMLGKLYGSAIHRHLHNTGNADCGDNHAENVSTTALIATTKASAACLLTIPQLVRDASRGRDL